MFDQTAEYMDHYEMGLYNHILASVAEDDAGNTYHVPLNPGAQKRFGNADMSGFTCCNGTASRATREAAGASIYFRSADDKTLYVNLFVPSRFDWAERKVVVTQHTDFPYADTTRLVLEGGGAFDIKVRVPALGAAGLLRHDQRPGTGGQRGAGQLSDASADVADERRDRARIPFQFYLAPVVDQPNVASVFYGPVLLAAEELAPGATGVRSRSTAVTSRQSFSGDTATLRFTIDSVRFKPFYESYGRNSAYLHVTLK